MMTIRKATQEDVPFVLPMVRRICQQHRDFDLDRYDYVGDPGKKYEHWLLERTSDPRSVFLVADDIDPDDQARHQLTGYLVATVERELAIYRLNEYGFVHDIWVESEARGEGVGKGLITAAVEAFTELGMEQVRLTTAADNQIARNMFSSCGFAPSSVEMLCVIPENATLHTAGK
jgi:ribosomal protein S18 acetylase RimI-like enzyme